MHGLPSAFYTAAPLILAGLIFVAMRLLMMGSRANLCITGFLACVIPSPLMLVAHLNTAIAMAGVGIACLVPAYLLAEDHDDDERGGEPDRVPPGPDPGSDPDHWSEFERDFWSHVGRTREPANV